MNAAYAEVITKTFRNDAIRSVSIIDDDAFSYKTIVEKSKSLSDSLASIKDKISRVDGKHIAVESLLADMREMPPLDLEKLFPISEICDFFQKNKIICDVDSAAEHLDPEKIRKSDLIILDYHLSPDDSTKSRDLIYKLSNTPHLNMVVVYTSSDLEVAWKETILTLRGVNEIELDSQVETIWDSLCEDDFFPSKWAGFITDEDIISIAETGKITGRNRGAICSSLEGEAKKFCTILQNVFVEKYLKHDRKIESKFISRKLCFDNAGVKWIQAGNVFVTFFQKNEVNNPSLEPRAIWDRLKDALVSWNPSYYRVILSEIQNKLDDDSLSMDKLAGKELYEQASVLWNVLSNAKSNNLNAAIDKTLGTIYEYLNRHALSNQELRDFVVSTADALMPIKDIAGANRDNILFVALNNFDRFKDKLTLEDENNILHALNVELSSFDILENYITTGTVLKSKETGEWYLCVSPSCNTVAGQGADTLAPHRPLRFIRLYSCDLAEALNNASHSNYLFVCDNGKRLAFSAVHEITKLPAIELGIVMDHDFRDLVAGGFKHVNFFNAPTVQTKIPFLTKTLIPVMQLRDSYAVRFQNMQSHYEGRIGVDFVGLKKE